MNEIVVPIDITQEEKAILAIFSMRQFFVSVPIIFLGLIIVIWGNVPFVTGLVDFVIRSIFAVLISLFAVALAFLKLPQYEQYLDDFIMTQIKYFKSQKEYLN